MIKYMLIAVIGFALSACAISNVDDDSASRTQGGAKPLMFEVFFEVDRWDISEAAAKIVREVADSSKYGSVHGITLSVHTSAAGWDANSQALSERRAEAIKAELVKDGVPVANITTAELGTARIAPTADGVREPQNRRTQIILQ